MSWFDLCLKSVRRWSVMLSISCLFHMWLGNRYPIMYSYISCPWNILQDTPELIHGQLKVNYYFKNSDTIQKIKLCIVDIFDCWKTPATSESIPIISSCRYQKGKTSTQYKVFISWINCLKCYWRSLNKSRHHCPLLVSISVLY